MDKHQSRPWVESSFMVMLPLAVLPPSFFLVGDFKEALTPSRDLSCLAAGDGSLLALLSAVFLGEDLIFRFLEAWGRPAAADGCSGTGSSGSAPADLPAAAAVLVSC